MPSKKRSYRKRRHPIWEYWDWSMDPETTRDVAGVVLLILGLILSLSIIHAAGSLGRWLYNFFGNVFGLFVYLLPIIFLAYGYILLFAKKKEVKASMVVGVVMMIIFFPAMLHPFGGAWGELISNLFVREIGKIAAIFALVTLSGASLIIALNTNFRTLFRSVQDRVSPEGNASVKVNQARISVFQMLKNKMGFGPKSEVKGGHQEIVFSSDQSWKLPSLDLLEDSSSKATSGNISKNVEIIQKTLADFGVAVSMGDVNIGPTVTQYTLKPAEGIKLNQIISRSNDLSLALAEHPIRIEAPIPGKSAVGIEVPNKGRATVCLRELLDSEAYKKSKSCLTLTLGRDVSGQAVVTDLGKMPHLLIAGATGSGKSVCIHSLLMSLLYRNSPADLRVLLVDPKRVEFANYNGIAHLLTPVITEVDKTINALRWAIAEMEHRFRLFAETGRRDIGSYNEKPPEGKKMPYIVIFIDELADLMAQAGREVESAVVRLAQLARATGIHLVVATQRPSVDVITGLIKANITTRIAFAVASQVDSRTILDLSGAEKLLGSGDMLFLSSELGKPKRIQGTIVSDREIKTVSDFLKQEASAIYDNSILEYKSEHEGRSGEVLPEDDLYEDAKEIVVQHNRASATLLQRYLRIGYARAARLLDLLEQNGIVGPGEGAKPRDVLVGPEVLAAEKKLKAETMQNTSGSQGPHLSGGFQRPQLPPRQSNPPINEPKPEEMSEETQTEQTSSNNHISP